MKYNKYFLLTLISLFLLSGCPNRCDINEQLYATFTNTFPTDVSIEFRYRSTLAKPFTIYTEIIPANETKSIFLSTIVHDFRNEFGAFKINCDQDSYDTNATNFQISSASISEYKFCYSVVEDNGIDIQAVGTVCDNGYDGITTGY